MAAIAVVLGLYVFISTAVHWYETKTWIWQFEWGMVWKATTLSGVLVAVALKQAWFFNFTWKLIGRFIAKEVPNISGVWVGSIYSNFPIHQRTHDYFMSSPAKEPFDNWFPPKGSDFFTLKDYKAEITITMTYLGIDVSMAVFNDQGERQSGSYTVTGAAELIVDGQRNLGRISYLYKSEKNMDHRAAPETEDDDEHYGSGTLDIVLNDDKIEMLKGTYWTQRNWSKGRNTGGKMEFIRKLELRS